MTTSKRLLTRSSRKRKEFQQPFRPVQLPFLFDPVSCTPGAGWEKGQVENQVGLARRRFFIPRSRPGTSGLNDTLKEQCINWAKNHKHPTFSDKRFGDVRRRERSPHMISLLPLRWIWRTSCQGYIKFAVTMIVQIRVDAARQANRTNKSICRSNNDRQ